MASSNTEIIARLSLNGTQFSSESSRIFGELEARSRDTGARMKATFETSFDNIKQIAQRALELPRGKGGTLQLDVTGAREAAAVAEAQAIALRQVAAAAEATAMKTGDLSENTRIYVTAAKAAAIEAENNSRELLQQANALELLQAELMQTASATNLVLRGNQQLNGSMRGNGMVTAQAGQQFQDFFIQVGGGQNVLMAATMQVSQLAIVMQGATGAAGQFASFMTGPWGSAVIAGLTIVSLTAAMIDFGDETDKAVDELKKQARQTDIGEAAQRRFARTIEGATEAIRESTEATRADIEASRSSAEQKNVEAKNRLENQVAILKETQAYLAQARAQLELAEARKRVAANDPRLMQGEQADASRERIAELERLEAKQAEAVAAAERRVQQTRVELAKEAADRMSDPIERIKRKYEEQVAAITKATRAQIDQGKQVDATLTRQIDAINKKRDAEIAAERERQQREKRAETAAEREAARTVKLGAPVEGRQSSGFGPRAAPNLPGGGRGSSNHPAIDYAVPVGTPVRAGAAGIVVHAGNLGGYGKALIIDYGAGTFAQFNHLSETIARSGDRVSSGEVIARSGNTGSSTGPHLDYRVRTGARFEDGRLQGGQWVNPNARVKVSGGDAIANLDDRGSKELEARREALIDIVKLTEQSLTVEAESLRFLGLKARGLDEQAQVEEAIAKRRREFADEFAKLSDDDRAAQSKVTDGLTAQIDLFRQQANSYAGLLQAAGDQTRQTEAQKGALDRGNAAMLEQLQLALALAKTAEDRRILEEAILRAQARVGTARATGAENAREAKAAWDAVGRELEKQQKDRAQRERDQIQDLAYFYRDAFERGTDGILDNFKEEFLDLITLVAAKWTLALVTGQKTSLGGILSDIGATSGAGGGVLSTLMGLGKKSSSSGTAGAAGSVAGAAAGVAGKAGILGSLSGALPYVGLALAAIPLLSGLFSSPKWGSASIGMSSTGSVVGTGGSGRGQADAAMGSANSVAEGVNRLAEQIGATITGVPGITVGSWNGRARVALTSTSAPLHSKNFGPDILKDFGEGGEQEAIAYAIAQAFTGAAIEGISQASKNIIKAGSADVEKALTKVMAIEDIPKRLKAYMDPVGAAVDDLNRKWKLTWDALKEGGASAEQMADAQKLYNIELEEAKAGAREAAATLKDYGLSLTMGPNSAYSLADQRAMAEAALKPLADTIASGGRIDQDKYREVAQTFLDIERQMYGSTAKYFESLGRVQELTNKAISNYDVATPIRADDTLAKSTADNTLATAEILAQQLPALGEKLDNLAAAIGGSGVEFIGGDDRMYVR